MTLMALGPVSHAAGRRRGVLTLYVRAGCDNKRYGACPFCQRIFMVLKIKAATESSHLRFKVATVPKSGLPPEFKRHGLRNLPAIIHGNEGIDTVEEIIDYIEEHFPEPRLNPDLCPGQDQDIIDKLTRNLFSKFCYYIKAVSKDSSALENELRRLDNYLKQSNAKFICGDELSHVDCEILPKLHHLRVAGAKLKKFEIPANYVGIWRYLNNAYNDECFVKTCPPDQEIVLHWADRPDTPNLSHDEHAALTRNLEMPRFSFDVPAIAIPINVH